LRGHFSGLEPQDFLWCEVAPNWDGQKIILVDKITHIPTGYYFIFDRVDGKAFPYYLPSEHAVTVRHAGKCDAWELVLGHVSKWVSVMKKEVLEPDLWKVSFDDKKLVAASIDDVQNSPFNLEEQERVKVAIGELRSFLHTTSDHSEAQLNFIDSRLQHLQDASSRLGRKDWITLAMGTLTNIVVGVALAPEAARELVRTAGSLLGWVVGGIRLML
jgi:hypothetical protein